MANSAHKRLSYDGYKVAISCPLEVDKLRLNVFYCAWKQAKKITNDARQESENDRLALGNWHVSNLLPLLGIDDEEEKEWDSFRLAAAVSLLETYALIIVSGVGDTRIVSMHSLIHAWARDRQGQRQQQESWLRTGCIVAMSCSKPVLYDMQPHVQALLSTKEQLMIHNGPKLMIAGLLLSLGNTARALDLDEDLFTLLQFLTRWLGLEGETISIERLLFHFLVGRNLLDLRRYKATVAQFERVSKTIVQILSTDLPDRVGLQAELATTYPDDRQAPEVVMSHEETVEIRGRSQAEDSPALLSSKHELARTCLEHL